MLHVSRVGRIFKRPGVAYPELPVLRRDPHLNPELGFEVARVAA